MPCNYPETWRVFEPTEPLAQEEVLLREEEYATGLEEAQTFVRFECPGVRLEYLA